MTQSTSKQTSLKTFARSTAALATLAFGLSFIAARAALAAPLKIGMTFQELNNPYFVTMQKALNDAAASIGATVVVTDAHHDVSKQVSDVEDMLQKKIDILLVNPTDSTGIQSAVTSAKKGGVVGGAVGANANGSVGSVVGLKDCTVRGVRCEDFVEGDG